MVWKSINGFEGYYEISDTGCVRSVDRDIIAKNGMKYHLKGKMMKLTPAIRKDRISDSNYIVVNLRKYGKSHVIPVHILVAKAFIPNPDNLPTVNHKDGNKSNNVVENLEWTSYAENNIHALRNNLRKPRGNPIAQKTDEGLVVGVYKSTNEASRVTGISIASISHCLNGHTNHAGGFVWEKISEDVTTVPEWEYAG